MTTAASKKTVAILGGSFNPPHEGHFEMGRYIYETLGVDEIWMLFSVNPFKDPENYASVEQRMEMGYIMAQHYPHVPFKMSDIEDRMDTHETYLILKALEQENPDTKFIWVMGADNLIEFHKWAHAEEFIQEFSIAVVKRPPYTEDAKNSKIVKKFVDLEIDNPANITASSAGWCFLGNPKVTMSSSHLLEQMRAGERYFAGPFQAVANYILQNNLYGFKTIKRTPQTRRPQP